MTLLVPVGMAVAIVPVLVLLLLAGLRVFPRFLVVVRTIGSPDLVFVVVPVMVVLVVLVIDPDLNIGALRPRNSHH